MKRENGESLIYYLLKTNYITYWTYIYKYTYSRDPQYINEIKGKENNCIISNTPPQAGAYMSYTPDLLQMYLILEPLKDLVKMSAS